MKIWHPQIYGLSGGPLTFMTYFDEIARNEGVEFVSNFYNANVVLGLNDWIPVDTVKKARKMKISYVHRVDGLFRPILKGFPDWEKRNERLSLNYREADFVIFQSRFSRDSYFDFFGTCKESRVIYNGVDINKFHPSKRNEMPSKVGLLGRELTHKQAEWRRQILEDCPFSVVELQGYKDSVEALKDIRVAILPDEQNNCPNQVLECMAMGIPVVVWKHTGAAELVLSSLAVDPSNGLARLLKIWEEDKKYSKEVRTQVVEDFDIQNTVKEYLQVMEQ